MPAKGPDEYYDDDLSVDELADIKALHDEEKRKERIEDEDNS
jgi:hypothetical protein